MPEILLPGAEIDRSAFRGSGPHPGDVYTLTWHSTESGPGSIEAMRRVLHDNRSESNVLIEFRAAAPGGRRIIQLVDLNRSSKSLRNTGVPGETNKAGTVQAEVIMRAADPVADTTPDDWRWLGKVGGDISRLVGVPIKVVDRFYPYPPDRWNPPQYLGREYWRDLDDGDNAGVEGWVGHQRWKENTHGDPGDWSSPDPRLGNRSPIALMLEGALNITTNPEGPDMPLDNADLLKIARTVEVVLDRRLNPDGRGNLLPRIRNEVAKQGPRTEETVKGVRRLLDGVATLLDRVPGQKATDLARAARQAAKPAEDEVVPLTELPDVDVAEVLSAAGIIADVAPDA